MRLHTRSSITVPLLCQFYSILFPCTIIKNAPLPFQHTNQNCLTWPPEEPIWASPVLPHKSSKLHVCDHPTLLPTFLFPCTIHEIHCRLYEKEQLVCVFMFMLCSCSCCVHVHVCVCVCVCVRACVWVTEPACALCRRRRVLNTVMHSSPRQAGTSLHVCWRRQGRVWILPVSVFCVCVSMSEINKKILISNKDLILLYYI